MVDTKGSKDGSTWEEQVRNDKSLAHGRFSNQQYIKNLTLLKNWCEKKISELEKIELEQK